MNAAGNLKKIIKDEGMKQYVVARRAGLSEKQFNALLNGRKTFTADLLIPICKAIGKSPDVILGFSNESQR